jgi:hypothetical protein
VFKVGDDENVVSVAWLVQDDEEDEQNEAVSEGDEAVQPSVDEEETTTDGDPE